MWIDILTLFPDMFNGPFDASIIKRAKEKGLVKINLINIRDFSRNKHHTVDDKPFGGGQGMVINAPVIFEAVDWLEEKQGKPGRIILLCPDGRTFNQDLAWELSRQEHILLICGHYEGIDERVREHLVTDEISIGDYILTGGELPAMVLVDSIVRLIPGVLGKDISASDESFNNSLLEHPQYTRPRDYRGHAVPDVLLSGNHERIRCWRRYQSLLRTLIFRTGLLAGAEFTPEDKNYLKQILAFLKGLDLEE